MVFGESAAPQATAAAKLAGKEPANKRFAKAFVALLCAFVLSFAMAPAAAWAEAGATGTDSGSGSDSGTVVTPGTGSTDSGSASGAAGSGSTSGSDGSGSDSGASQTGESSNPTVDPTPEPTPTPTPVQKISLSKATVTLSKTSFTYTGKAQKPSVKKVVVNGKTLKAGTDYTASIAKGKNAGTYKVVVSAKGSTYTGSKTVTYAIKALKASKFKLTLSKTAYSYNGKAKKPKVTVKATVSGKTVTLKKNRDYKLSYKNNVQVGKASVVVTGKGNFKGTKTAKFKINGGSTGSNKAMAKKANGYASNTKYLILVNCKAHKVGIYKGSKGNWKQIKLWSCTNGASSTPTVKGSFTVQGKGLHFGEDKGYTCWYYTQFYGNYLFHSVLYYPNSKTKIKSGVLGVAASHGCVRLAKSNAKWIYDNIPRGTKVVSY